MLVYSFDSHGIFTGPVTLTDADRSPLEVGVFLIPGDCTAVPAPQAGAGQRAVWDGAQWTCEVIQVAPAIPLLQRQAAAWERIKNERDRRKLLGVKVGDHWYHSDDSSRIQQLSLFVMGAAVPPVQWKTLTTSPPPVFVTMTQAIASGIFQATAASDAAVFGAAEVHRLAMEESDHPEDYDISSGWPASIEDEQ